MCITYLSRDSCRNLICKNLGYYHPSSNDKTIKQMIKQTSDEPTWTVWLEVGGHQSVDSRHHGQQVELLAVLLQTVGQSLHKPRAIRCVPPAIVAGDRGEAEQEVGVGRNLVRDDIAVGGGAARHEGGAAVQLVSLTCLKTTYTLLGF